MCHYLIASTSIGDLTGSVKGTAQVVTGGAQRALQRRQLLRGAVRKSRLVARETGHLRATADM